MRLPWNCENASLLAWLQPYFLIGWPTEKLVSQKFGECPFGCLGLGSQQSGFFRGNLEGDGRHVIR